MTSTTHSLSQTWARPPGQGSDEEIVQRLATELRKCVEHDNPWLSRATWYEGGLGVALVGAMLHKRDPSLFVAKHVERLVARSLQQARGLGGLVGGSFACLVCFALLEPYGVRLRFDRRRTFEWARQALFKRLESVTTSVVDFDLINGATGVVVGLELLRESSLDPSRELFHAWLSRLEEVTRDRLERFVERAPDGFELKNYGGTHYGIAHGLGGALAVLAEYLPTSETVGLAWSVLHTGIRSDAYGPYLSLTYENPTHHRAAWCNGLPGVVAALAPWAAEREIDGLFEDGMLSLSKRPWSKDGLVLEDGKHDLAEHESICHGVAGLDLCLASYRARRDSPGLRAIHGHAHECLLSWAARRVEHFDPAESDCSLMTGLSGLAATLLACQEARPQSWVRLLLFPSARSTA